MTMHDLTAEALLRGVARVTRGSTSQDPMIERRLMIEFCTNASADMIALYLAVERRHAGLVHDGPAEDCDICQHQAGAFFNGALIEIRPLRLSTDVDEAVGQPVARIGSGT
jgi:hypothetical protein